MNVEGNDELSKVDGCCQLACAASAVCVRIEDRLSGLREVPGYMDINTPSHTLMEAFGVFGF